MGFGITAIYKLTGVDKSIYIGQTKNYKRRVRDHSKKTATAGKLKEYFEKYGYKSHTIEVLHELPSDIHQQELDDHEKLYIAQYRDCGFEMLNTQSGGLIGKHSMFSKLKMSEIKKGNKLSKETKEKMLRNRTKVLYTEDLRNKLRLQKIGKLNPMFNKPVSLETRKKISDANKGKRCGVILSAETKNKLRLINEKKVFQFSLDNKFIKEWCSVKEAQTKLNIHKISENANNKRRTAGGFIWRYKL